MQGMVGRQRGMGSMLMRQSRAHTHTHNLKRAHHHTHTHTHHHTQGLGSLRRLMGPSVPTTTHTHTHMRAITCTRACNPPLFFTSTNARIHKALLHHATHSEMVRPIRAITRTRTRPGQHAWPPHHSLCRPLATTHTHTTAPHTIAHGFNPHSTACVRALRHAHPMLL